ncbi:phosphatidylserine/phosphatidylglycerophosphate/cardiolipin synthase [Methyloglobulus morosus KoM1]|uniref:Phosphatidylserine/phosphatidylglycerophosphate/ cardiolipin synthase n=1 Tax=Methyloglobulus morosus KoM1 TaxID=1116472 RepID=V5DFM4_9GAMM|nr:phospholipase D-like domain-containing protein [Methyloglobulus morosus]ESS66226.1 phosphatidylserine/phosphatidylglycerophosphate/cardiolipin synthase [Methyloglobulus morosus KoM1]
MQELIITNSGARNLKHLLAEYGDKADQIRIVTAFFSDTEFIINWLDNSKQVDLLVSLRPPTNYYSLKTVYPKIGINIQFLGVELHSKFFIFYRNGNPFACIIGSSNFTTGGLHKNIETNAIFTDTKYLNEIEKHFATLWEQSYLLQPTDLEPFKIVFDNFQKRAEKTEKEQSELQKKILTGRITRQKKSKVGKEAKQYYSFWRVVDDVKEMVNDISAKEYPNVPVYISIDHFWHWVMTVWNKENRPKPTSSYRKSAIPKLFKEYCDWDKSNNNFTKQMAITSRTLFAKLLSENNIDKLSEDEAQKIYSNLHSGAMRTRRFGSDKLFVQENHIKSIRASLKYLLYSNDEIDLRIHNLCVNPDYKLSQFKSSGTQEIIGWVSPDKYPIRNKKADDALKLLGFKLE